MGVDVMSDAPSPSGAVPDPWTADGSDVAVALKCASTLAFIAVEIEKWVVCRREARAGVVGVAA